MTIVAENFDAEVQYGYQCLEDSLQHDPDMLRDDTQQNGVTFLYLVGRARLCGSESPLPKLEPRLVTDALRHAGNNVLEQVGPDQRQYLSSWRNDDNMACGLIDSLFALRCTEAAAQAYLATLDEDEPFEESLRRELRNFQTIAKIYEDGVKSHPNGIRALTWAYRNTSFVRDLRALLPADAPVPWFFDPTWYENYGMDKA